MQRWRRLYLLEILFLNRSHGFAPVYRSPSVHPDMVALSMVRVAELRRELDQLQVDYSDCFDKESLEQRLQDAMEGRIHPKQAADVHVDYVSTGEFPGTTGPNGSPSNEIDETTTQEGSAFDETKVYEEVRAMKVKELREELARRRIRWADLLEKGDLVRAVVNARKIASKFSSNIKPGTVADLTEEQVQQEIQSSSTPLLLDVYATWCGPCKMMAKELSQAAEEWQDRIRVAKMDSDQFPNLSTKLKVQGLPTIILYVNGQESDRLEGALPKAQLMEWVERKLSS